MRQFYFSAERRFNTWLCSLVLVLLSTVAIGQRVTHNLVSLYDFQEGSGSVVNDVSGNSPINLNIQHPGNVTWLPEGGLRINSSTIIRTTGAATRMHTALSSSAEFSFEAWIKPSSASQAGPARIATMSSNTSNRNFMLGQDGSNYVFRTRTTGGGDNNGMPQVSTSPAVVNLQHYVYTWKNGTERIYLNGQLKYTGTRGGALSNWSSSFAFALGNEMSLDRAWLGDLHLVAVYCQELDQNEVNTNFNEGPGIDYGTPVLEETCVLTGYDSPTGRNFWLPAYATDFAPTGPGVVFEKYTNGTAHIYGRVRSLTATSKEFEVDLWFNYKKNYQQWIASGGDIKEPQLGNVNFWTFYDFDEKRINMLTGANSLAGQRIFLYKMPTNSYGLQIGDGANALNSNANGMSAWFNFFGSQNDHGDINATYNCAPICDANLTNVVFYNITTGTSTPLVNGGSYTAASLGNNWNIEALTTSSAQSVRFTFSGNHTATNVENWFPYRTPGDGIPLNLAAGTYSLNIKVYTEDNAEGILCDEETYSFTITGCDNATNGGQIGYSQSGCIGFDPAAFENLSPPSGGSGALQIIWIRKSASTNWAYVEIPGATGLTYDSGPLTETTVFRRCARREFCSAYLAESNELTVTVSGQCCSNITHPGEIAANQTGCAPYDPAPFTSVSLPTGGSGAIEYVWIYKNASTNWNWVNLPNSNSPTYDAPVINETTEYRRCSRRAGCVDFVGESNILTVTVTGNCTPEEICLLNGYESTNGRIFWIPAYGTDFRSSASNPLKLEKYADGKARIVGTIERASNTNHKFNVSLWLDTKSNFAQWQAMGLTAHSPELGDESTWIYYKWSTTLPNTLIGTGSLAGVTLNLSNMDPVYGWQLGNGANALNTNANGISSWFSYTGTTSGNGDVNGSYDCPSNCNVNVNAGPDQEICGPVTLTLTANTTGASNCVIPGVSDCNHTLVAQGGYVVDASTAAACGSQIGAKLWTAGNQGTSFVVLDFGTVVPAGTQICANMKLEHCSQSNTSWSNVKIEGSLNQNNNYFVVNSSIIFSNTNYQEFCYTLAQPARYVKVVDNGACSIRLDYVKYTTPNGGSNALTYAWSGPGIVGPNNIQNINVNQPGTYTVTVTDCNGCSDSDTVVVTNDDEDPIFTSNQQVNYQLACGQAVPLIQPTATDNNGAVTYTFVDNNVCVYPSSVCACTQVRVWTATDLCGNTATFTQNFIFSDNVNPVLQGVPANYTAQCGAAPSVPVVTATDNCDNDVTVTFTEQVISASCPIQMVRTWTATDNCGNTVSASQTIFVDDTTNPVLVGVPANATVQCSAIPAPAPVTATDNCSTNLVVQFEQVTGTGCPYTITRTWSVTDNCGNVATATQVLQVVDTQIPTLIGVPANATMECDQPIMDAVVNAIDNCTPVADLVVSSSAETVQQDCGYLFIRTWTVTDNCGNVASASQTITVLDTVDPTITSAPSPLLELECSQVVPVGEVAFDDNCDEELDIDFSEVVSNETACGRDITRTWVATDDCGNSVSFVQVIRIRDTTDPVLENVPSNTTVSCDEIPAPANVIATDNCSNPTLVFNEVQSQGCPYTITRTWTATDSCGNSTTAIQVIQVLDTIDPTLVGVPTNYQAQCGSAPSVPVVTATDNCDTSVEVVFSEQVISASCPIQIVRTWTAIDNCGNEQSASQTIYIDDTINPVLVGVPANVQAQCGSAPAVANVTATDNCDINCAVVFTEQVISASCPINIIRTWTATDNCGNSTSASQTIYIDDTINPVLVDVPANTTVECDAIPAPAAVSATDNCDSNIEVVFSEIATTGCPYTITRTWSATDACGNTTVATQVIEVIDTVDPMLVGVPANYQAQCGSAPSVPVVTATDNCDTNVEVVFSEQVLSASCPIQIVRTWTAIDNCGNEQSASQTIYIDDTINPVLVGVPANVQAQCGSAPAVANVTATDNCDINCAVVFTEQVISASCPINIIRTWTATDNCGNSTSASQTIYIDDTINPVLVDVPANTTVECDAIPAPAAVSATDNCDANIQVIFSEVATTGCPYTITRTWSATDACGNTTVATQVIEVIDTVDPMLVGVPANYQAQCGSAPSVPVVTATDNCDTSVEVVFSEQVISASCPIQIVRTWTAIDNCGNEKSATQTIYIDDTIQPVLVGVPADATVECDAIPAAAVVTATDNCDTDVNVVYNEVVTSGVCTYYIFRTWTATDNCGNSVSAEQILTVVDTTQPELVGVPADETVECDNVPAPAIVTATDNCDEEMEVIFSESTEMLECGYRLIRTWSVSDDCSNSTSATQIVTVVDTTAPVISGQDSQATLECNVLPSIVPPTVEDNCDENVELVFGSSVIPGNCENSRTEIYTWTATDNCGNTSVRTLTFYFQDTTDPTFDFTPGNLSVSCDAIPAAAELTASDNCDNAVEVTFSEVSGSGCEYQIVRTWTATDNCGNSTSYTQYIAVADTTNPVINGVPADATVACDAIPAVATTVTAEDNCSGVELGFSEEVVPGAPVVGSFPCGSTIYRRWTAIDDCGNLTQATQVLTVIDTVAPELVGVPADLTVECGSVPAPAQVSATDNCNIFPMQVIFSELTVPVNACTYQLVRTWSVQDNCGNMTSDEQVITVVDTTAPVLNNVPSNATVACDDVPAPAVVTAEDICDGSLEVVFSEVETEGCPYTITRRWVATDACGNETAAEQVLTVIDEENPTLVGVPANETLECTQPISEAIVSAIDNCDEDMVVSLTSQTVQQDCGFQIIRTWSVSDDCGNVTEATQVTTFVDTQAPVIVEAPAEEVIYECDETVLPLIVEFADSCDNVLTITQISGIDNQDECSYDIIRSITATDDCGNSTTFTQVVRVRDTTAPEFTFVPEGGIVSCDAIPSIVMAQAEDNCVDLEDVTVTVQEIVSEGCPYTITRIFTATDLCGNANTASQVLIVNDTTNPTLIGVPANVQAQCGTLPSVPTVTGSDNCDTDVTVEFNEQVLSAACPIQVIRTWTATDNCGNQTSASQTIYINDTTNPVLVNVPANVTVECDAVPAPANVTATDNCSTNLVVNFEENQIDADCGYTLVRTWSVEDACGNEAVRTQMITVVDTTSPELSGEDEELTFECNMTPMVIAPTASDNCDENVEVVFNSQTIPGDCENNYSIVYTWTATDDCGNQDVRTIVHNFQDTTKPTFDNAPANLTVPCDAIPAPAAVTAQDNCDMDVVVTFNEVVGTGCPYTITRTWTATDNCGNQEVATQVLTVVDTVDPYFTSVSEDQTIECTDEIPVGYAQAGDNCDTNVDVTMVEVVEELTCETIITRTWTATDNCGNTATAQQVITIVDTVDPFIVDAPSAEVTILCNQPEPTEAPVFDDACDDNLQIVAISGIANVNDCGYDIEKVWTAIDDCGNAISFSRVIHVVDTIAPEFVDVPANATVECSNIPAPAEVTAEDNCTAVSIEFTQEELAGNGCTYTIERVWTATDVCGNETTYTQVLTVVDTTQPTVEFEPSDITVECGQPIPMVSPVFADNCDDNISVEYSSEIVRQDACGYDEERTWVAVDNCGNETVVTQLVTVEDTTDPVLEGVPANVTAECSDVPAAAVVTATDNCDDLVNVVFSEEMQDAACGYTLIRRWSATDICGNVAEATQVVTVVDTTNPFVSEAPADAVYACDETIPYTAPVFGDLCDDNLTVVPFETVTPNGCNQLITRRWVATDDCGNSVEVIQLISVVDTIAPVITGPAAMVASCTATAIELNVVTEDNCDEDVTLTFVDLQFSGGCEGFIQRTWTATDDCGNSSTLVQVIQRTDDELPTIATQPEDITVECDEVVPVFTPEFADNCDDDLTVEFTETEQTLACGYQITRVWEVTDNCENTLIVDQVITVVDTTDPELVGVPSNVTVLCDQIPSVANVTATDNCDDNLVVTFAETVVPAACGEVITRTWRVEDNCGNSSVASQVITVTDTIAPALFNVPGNIQIVCGSPIPAPSTAVTATDNCTDDLVVTVTETEGMDGCERIIYRTYSVEDACGNEASATQQIRIIDNVAPTFDQFVSDMTVNCDEIPAAPVVTATDNCDEIDVVFEEVVSAGCPYTIERTWTATDACGNESMLTQTITVVDNELPVFDPFPVFIQVQCDEVAAYTITASDNCDSDVEVVIEQELVFSGSCYGTLQRIYRATDNCGNSVTALQLIDIIDSEAPVFTSTVQNVTVSCDMPVPAIPTGLTAEDNCDDNVEITFNEVQTSQFCPFDIVRTWTAEDECGNQTQLTQVITVTVETAPIFHLSAYPNPTAGDVVIEFSSPKPGKLDAGLYDISGRKIETIFEGQADGERLYKYSFNAREWNAGAYMIRVISEDAVHQQRLVVTGK